MSDKTNDSPMSLIEHLEELRKRIIISIIAIAVGMTVCYIFQAPLLRLLVMPLNGRELITLTPTESFMTVFKVAAYAGVVVASPVLIYQIWAFAAPGLRQRERRVILSATAFTTLLFLAGVVFAWYLVLPTGLNFLLSFESDFFNQQVQATPYFTFVALFLLGFGLIFETPALILSLVFIGIVDVRMLSEQRKYAILIGAVVSAVITPGTDFFSMLAMFVPFLVLYEVSVLLARVIERSRRRKKAAQVVEDGPEGETTR
ncbi:MAG: twin-arginine translocase subunit TatC [Thermoleophilia bacterium]